MVKVASFHPGQEALVAQIHNAGFDEWIRRLGRAYSYREVMSQDVLEEKEQ